MPVVTDIEFLLSAQRLKCVPQLFAFHHREGMYDVRHSVAEKLVEILA